MKLANLPEPTAAHNFSSQRLLGNNFTQFQQLSAAPALATACFYTAHACLLSNKEKMRRWSWYWFSEQRSATVKLARLVQFEEEHSTQPTNRTFIGKTFLPFAFKARMSFKNMQNSQCIEFRDISSQSLGRQQLHGRISPQRDLQQPAKTRQRGPRRGSRWGRWNDHLDHRWRKWYHWPLQPLTSTFLREALRPLLPSTEVGSHYCMRPPRWEIFNLSNTHRGNWFKI